MGFNKIILPDVKEMKERYKQEPKSTLNWIMKADAIIGPVESVRYVEKLLKKKNSAMNFKKRTKEEIDYAVDVQKDYTGGYEFWPWLIYMRLSYLIGLFLNAAIGLGSFITGDKSDWITWAAGGFFGVFAPALISYKLLQDYKKLKKGIGR
jgi:hypothetical protein